MMVYQINSIVDAYQKAADKNDKWGLYLLATLYSTGIASNSGFGLQQNLSKAYDYFNKAAAFNFPPAQFYLAEAYQKGAGIAKNETRALQLYSDSAKNGFRLAIEKLKTLPKPSPMTTQFKPVTLESVSAKPDEKVNSPSKRRYS